MKRLQRLLAVVLVFVGIVGVTLDARADSVPITTAPTSFDVFWTVDLGATGTLTANATFNITNITSTFADLTVTIRNTTDPSLNTIVSSFGFNTDPSVTATFSGVGAGTVFDGLANDTNFPSFQTIEVCVFSSSNCSSSAFNEGLAAGKEDTVGLRLSGSFGDPASLTLSTFALKFAGDQGSFQPEGRVPIPGTFLLFGVGLIGFVAWQARNDTLLRSSISC